jgi:hypothetical protein
MRRLREQLGIRFFFGTDDNFFNSRAAVEQIFEAMARARVGGRPIRKALRWGTEATALDTWKNRDLLKLGRRGGLRALWFGIEDVTATLVKKGQSVNRTAELFRLLNRVGVMPMPMIMYHEGQPLYTRDSMYGLLNQVRFLRHCGAQSMQITVLTPATGTRSFEANYEKGTVFDTVGGRRVLEHQFDGNNVVSSLAREPWRDQLRLLLAYAMYYNPGNLICSLLQPVNRLYLADAYDQLSGMVGLCFTALHSAKWAYRLWRGPITRNTTPPGPKKPLIDVSPRPVEQAEPTTETRPAAELVQVSLPDPTGETAVPST